MTFSQMTWIIVVCAASAVPTAERTWTDASGRSKTEARAIAVRDGMVLLKKSDGTVINVELKKLSREDQELLLSPPKHKQSPAEPPAASGKAVTPVAAIRGADDSVVGEIRRFPEMGWGVESMAFSPNGGLLAVGKMDRTLIVFDVDKARPVASFDKLEPLGAITCVAFSPNGKTLLAGGSSGRIQAWSVEPDGRLTPATQFFGHRDKILAISFSADGKTVLSGGSEKAVRCWDLNTGRERFVIDGFPREVKATFLTRSGKQGLGCDGTVLALIDVDAGEAIQTMRLCRGAPQYAAISPDGQRVLAGDLSEFSVWDIRSGDPLPKLDQRENVWSGQFLHDSRFLLAGSRGTVALWKIDSQQKLHDFDAGSSLYVKCLAVSPDRLHFAAIPSAAGQTLQVFRMPAEIVLP